MIDLRSDTITRPTPGMLDSMMHAEVGDDVMGEDPSTNELQEKTAELFGMEAALFCPTGTMTNQIAIKVHTQPGDELICHELAHIYLFEGGGIAFNSACSAKLLSGDNGRFTAGQIVASINNRNDSHYPFTRLVAIENTVNKGGGACWDINEIRRIRAVCDDNDLALHLDGARLFNALVAKDETPKQYGELFDTISICLSKGLGTPAGSILLGTRAHIARAHRYRKVMGGGMRQAGYLAATGIYALDNHVDRLAEDHRRAKAVEKTLRGLSYVAEVLPVETNIVIFRLKTNIDAVNFLNLCKEKDVNASTIGPGLVRMVIHLDISDANVHALIEVLQNLEEKTATTSGN